MSLSAGAFIVKKPQEYSVNSATIWILDEKSKSGWSTPKNVTAPQVIVIALPEQTLLDKVVFDTGSVSGAERAAKDILVEVSDTNADEGFRKIVELSLKNKADNQQFPVSAPTPGRWVRLTVKNNYGSPEYTDSDSIKDESKPTLDQIASLVKAKPEWKMTIEGHTDARGSAEHNQGLSERRANAVKLYLQSAGIESTRLRAAGYGFSQPVGPNDNPLGRAQNRRVELIRQ